MTFERQEIVSHVLKNDRVTHTLVAGFAHNRASFEFHCGSRRIYLQIRYSLRDIRKLLMHRRAVRDPARSIRARFANV